MDLDLAAIKAAFAELSKPELHALINAAKAAPQLAPLTLHVERLLFDHRYDRLGSKTVAADDRLPSANCCRSLLRFKSKIDQHPAVSCGAGCTRAKRVNCVE